MTSPAGGIPLDPDQVPTGTDAHRYLTLLQSFGLLPDVALMDLHSHPACVTVSLVAGDGGTTGDASGHAITSVFTFTSDGSFLSAELFDDEPFFG